MGRHHREKLHTADAAAMVAPVRILIFLFYLKINDIFLELFLYTTEVYPMQIFLFSPSIASMFPLFVYNFEFYEKLLILYSF